MMNTPKRYLVTAALPYANGPLHIGHLAGAYLSADIYSRFLRLQGKEVVFVCGSDEHGAAITIKAKKEGISPKEIIDKYHALFVDTFEKMGIKFDIYHRTSAPLHHETAQEFFQYLYDHKQFEELESEQYFDVQANQFLADRYIMGTCPKCGNPNAYGDQCENCGSTLNPTELIEPRSTLSGEKPILKTTKHWYLPLNNHEQWLKDWIENGKLDGKNHHDPEDWKSHVLGQCKSWLDGGLQPRAMTRDLEWGVDVPKDIPHSDGKKLYVWMDAPIGYISATKQWAMDQGKPEEWTKYWQDDDSTLIHFIGKDNIVFHCLIFPIILKAHGKYNLPINVPANQFLNLEGQKISTSRNWAVWVHEYLEDFDGMQDVLRYNMIKNMPEQRDSEFTWKNFQETNNNELVNNIANFVNRVVVLINKYYEGKVPDFDPNTEFISGSNYNESYYDVELIDLYDKVQEMSDSLYRFDFRSGLKSLMEISSIGNALLQNNEPWKTIKTDPEKTAIVLNLALQIVAVLRVCADPFMPFTAEKLSKLLNLPSIEEKGELQELMELLANGACIIEPEHQISEANHLFVRISDEVIEQQINKLHQSNQQNTSRTYEPLKPTISFDDFAKIDLRSGKIIQAKKVSGAKKLLELTVDLGFEQRTIVSGIAEHYDPEKIVGTNVVVVANLAPRALRGIESQGMILMAEDENNVLHFVNAITGGGNSVK